MAWCSKFIAAFCRHKEMGAFRQEEWGREQYHKYKESVLIRVLPLLSSRDLFFLCVCVRVGGWVWERVRGREE